MNPLDPNARFSWSNVRALCALCADAYDGERLAPPTSGNLEATRWMVSDFKTDTGVLVQDCGNCIAIAFRGSRNIADYIQDAKIFLCHPREQICSRDIYCREDAGLKPAVTRDAGLKPATTDTGMEVHSGIWENVSSVIEELVEVLRQLADGRWKMGDGINSHALSPNSNLPTPIFVTGHSKGAGEALLAALELKRQKFNVVSVITFGGLRVFNGAGAAIYDNTPVAAGFSPACATMNVAATLKDITFRVVNQNDIVPRLPLAISGYRHCGQEIFLPVGGGWELNPSLWSKALSDALGIYAAWRHKDDVLIRDHILGGSFGYKQRIQLL